MIVIVPDTLRAAIDAKLDAAIADCPGSEVDREHLYGVLLGYFNEHGVVPDFSIKPNDPEIVVVPKVEDAPREEYPDNGPTDPWRTSGPGTGGAAIRESEGQS